MILATGYKVTGYIHATNYLAVIQATLHSVCCERVNSLCSQLGALTDDDRLWRVCVCVCVCVCVSCCGGLPPSLTHSLNHSHSLWYLLRPRLCAFDGLKQVPSSSSSSCRLLLSSTCCCLVLSVVGCRLWSVVCCRLSVVVVRRPSVFGIPFIVIVGCRLVMYSSIILE